MSDENEKEIKFEQVAVIPEGEKIYAILKPVDEMEEPKTDEIVFTYEKLDDGQVKTLFKKIYVKITPCFCRVYFFIKNWKIVLDKRTSPWFNDCNQILHQTKDAEVKLSAHPQRVPEAENGAKSGAANGPPRAGGKG